MAVNASFPDTGYFQVNVTAQKNTFPIENATIQIRKLSAPETMIEEIKTDKNGQSEVVSLAAPPLEYSLEPESMEPYANYDILVEADGYESVNISGVQILPGQTALQEVSMIPVDKEDQTSDELFVIPPHTLYGDYPPKIPEDEIKPQTITGEIVLSRVVIPEYIIVHDGPPDDPSAQNYYVKYKDYIKNVASSRLR